jgi:hypothetical protein
MVKSVPTSPARLTQDDGGGHTGWVKEASPVTWDSRPRRVAGASLLLPHRLCTQERLT